MALRPATAAVGLGSVSFEPPDALVPVPSNDGAVVLFLRGTPREVVYAVPVVREDGRTITVEHRLAASGAPPVAAPV